MAKPEWGTKRICQSCGARFYDLGRSPIICPACGAIFDLELLNRARRARPSPRAAAAPAEEMAGEEAENLEGNAGLESIEDDAEVEDAAIEGEDGEEEDESLIEDASELGEDEDMSDVIDSGLDEEEPR
ncbi:MAG: TIGR02300 family protein [Geminicoccaceae bacterium]